LMVVSYATGLGLDPSTHCATDRCGAKSRRISDRKSDKVNLIFIGFSLYTPCKSRVIPYFGQGYKCYKIALHEYSRNTQG
jgi:hypothetical protein